VNESQDRARRVEEELREAEAKYQALVEQIPAILYIDLPDENDSTVYVSPQIEEILGISPDVWINDPGNLWVEQLHPEDRERVIKDYEEFLSTGKQQIHDYRMMRPDGRVVWIHDRSTIVRDEEGKPLLIQGVMFDVTQEKVAEAIAATQVEMLKKVDAIGREFTDLVLRGAGLKQILQALAGIVENPVVLEDAAHQLVEFAAHSGSVDDLLKAWDEHSRSGHDEDARGVVHLQNGTPPCAWIPIWLRDQLWGRVHIIEIDRPTDDIDHLALDRAAAAVGLALYSERHADHTADHARGALISDIWQGRYSSAKEVLKRARGLGADFEGKTITAVVVEPRDLGSEESERQRLRAGVLRETRGSIAAAGLAGLSAIVGDRVLAVVAADSGKRDSSAIDKAADQACIRIAEDLGIEVVVGLSNEADQASLKRALEEAAETGSFGIRTGSGSSVHHFRELGVHHLLVRLSEGPELARFVESELGPLLEHDAKSGSPLVPTLRAYLANGGRKAQTARDLHVERRSLYYRLERIERLLKKSIEDQETRVRLEIAMRSLDLLGQRPAPPAGR
jgi:purine catabolism regulator